MYERLLHGGSTGDADKLALPRQSILKDQGPSSTLGAVGPAYAAGLTSDHNLPTEGTVAQAQQNHKARFHKSLELCQVKRTLSHSEKKPVRGSQVLI